MYGGNLRLFRKIQHQIDGRRPRRRIPRRCRQGGRWRYWQGEPEHAKGRGGVYMYIYIYLYIYINPPPPPPAPRPPEMPAGGAVEIPAGRT